MTATLLPPATALGAVHLRVRDLAREVEFYTRELGFQQHARTAERARLGAGGAELLVLNSDPAARPAPGSAGLYHFAVLVPGRADLARVLRGLMSRHTPLQGAADHGVSEAIYLADPEGNGIEIYRDRPRGEWPRVDGALRMVTDPFDADGVLGEFEGTGHDAGDALPAGTRIGHVHLQVSDLAAAERFYTGVVGFDLVQRYGHSALFVSAGGYHHHLGLNTWAGAGAPPPPPGAAGLERFDVLLPDAAAIEALAARARAAGVAVSDSSGALELHDPTQHLIRFQVQTREVAS